MWDPFKAEHHKHHENGDAKMVRYGLFKQSKGRAAEVNGLSQDRVFGTNRMTVKHPHRKSTQKARNHWRHLFAPHLDTADLLKEAREHRS